jgi:hypothetical protein
MKQVVLFMMIVSLAGCGGFHKAKRGAPPPKAQPVYTPAPTASTGASSAAVAAPVAAPVARPFARGPINTACMASDRKARSRELCGCIQAVADNMLSASQQRIAVSFYIDPHKAQEVRQSDRASDEQFWEDYRAYGDAAERTCS